MDNLPNPETIRSLASIQKITNVINHPNADRLDIVQVLGWKCICQRGEFQVDDICCYIEIDSILPEKATWIPPTCKVNPKGVKTIRLRGELSQGLVIHMDYFRDVFDITDVSIGQNITNILGITLPLEEHEEKGIERKFPAHLLPKTDQPRIQSNPELAQKLRGQDYYASIKIDGTSSTFLIDPHSGDFLVCSRNYVRSRDETDLYWQIATKYDIEKKLQFFPNLAIQGEIYGPKLQHNLLRAKELQLYVFNIYLLDEHRYCTWEELINHCNELDLPLVPYTFLQSFDHDIPSLLEMAKGLYAGTKNHREGLVISNMEKTISFKVINNDYLLAIPFH